jgi:hypothetical protein
LWVALLTAVVAWISTRKPEAPAAAAAPPVETRSRTPRTDSDSGRFINEDSSRSKIQADWNELLAWLGSDPPPGAVEIRQRLLALRAAWAELDPHILAEMLATLLAGGVDMETGLPFRPGMHGFLQSWPTLRVFLIDTLGASDPEAAAITARELLASTPSADEFAVALRPLTRKGLGRAADAELLGHFNRMIARDDWAGAPGFASAFDLPRLLGSTDAARSLIEWDGNPKLRAMALDEFAADHPATALAALAGETSHLDPVTRATLMARSDPSDPAQLAAVDAYLRNPALPAEEANAFLKAFPLRSATTGYRLYGKPPAPYSYDTIVAGDRAALERIDQWLQDPALERHREHLGSLRERLVEWSEQTR